MEDSDWLRRSFMVSDYTFNNADMARRQLTEAEFKFTDTTLGGNFAINPPPQFTRFADLPVPSRFSQSDGMGRYYSEALDDRGQYIHMRFGVPEFNSLTNFFFNFYNAGAAGLANTGRAPGNFYYLGKAAGFIVSLPVQPFIWTGQVIKFFAKKPASKFYYLKPAMPLYWSAVSNILNGIGVNMGVIGRGMSEGEARLRKGIDDPQPGEHEALHQNMVGGNFPNIYRSDGGIDIYKVATRAQRMAIQQRKAMSKVMESGGSFVEMAEEMRKSQMGEGSVQEPQMDNPDLDSFLKSYHESNTGKVKEDEEGEREKITNPDEGGMTVELSEDEGFLSHLQSELEDGAAFVTFRVDNQGEVSESFSNQTGESPLSSTLKGVSSSARQARFSFANGNLADIPVLGDALNSVKDMVSGALDSVKMSGLMALGGSAFADIPEIWESSSAEFPTATYTIELRSPYGTPMARFQNLMVPLSMLLASALPLAAGRQSHTSPFLCELYSQGRNQIRLGMVESLSISRGTGNVGWTRNGEPLGIDVSITVADLSSIMSMPISSNFGVADAAIQATAENIQSAANDIMGGDGGPVGEFGSLLDKSTFDDDNSFTDYLAVLGSLGLQDQIYPSNKLRLNRAKRMADWEQWKSPAHHANWMAGTQLGRVASMITHTTNRQ